MNQPTLLSRGGFADVWDMHDATVLKAFRSEPRANGHYINGDLIDHDLLTGVFCTKEIKTYEKVVNIDEIRPFIPRFLGRRNPLELLPNATIKYVENAGFLLEKICGSDLKIAHLPARARDEVETTLSLIANIANDVNVWDASCF